MGFLQFPYNLSQCLGDDSRELYEPKSELKIKHVPFAPLPQEPVAIRRSWLNVQAK